MDTARPHEPSSEPRDRAALWSLTAYFLKLGTIGFGGPPALIGYMHRDLVEREQSLDEDTYKLALALAQIMPGPLAAQTAIAIGYFQAGILGATLVGLAFVVPSFVMVIALSMAYVAFGGLWWMQALFYGIGAAVIAIIAIAAYKLARATNKRDPLLWGIFAVLLGATSWLTAAWSAQSSTDVGNVPLQILLFFTKAGAFVFGSGLAIVPFLYQGVVQQYGWLSEQQFLDAVAVAMITPGPVVITVAFIGYLVAGFWGATAAATGAIAGAVVVLGLRSIYDVPTALIGLVTFGLLWRFKLQEPIVVAAAGLAGLVIWPWMSRG